MTQSVTDEAQIDDATLISWLAEGVDPFTGEVLPKEHVLQQPQIIRALFHAVQALRQTDQKTEPKKNLPASAGKAWSTQEDSALAQEFDAAMPIAEIASLHGRTKGAITSRLVRLGKIAAREDVEGF